MSAHAVRVLVVVLAGAACRTGPPAPATLDSKHDVCAQCRMVVSDTRFASQIVQSLEDPKFFDDLDCLANYLKETGAPPPGAAIYVADHRTRAWIPAASAVYTQTTEAGAPMGSRIIAHAGAASRDQDPAASGGRFLDLAAVLPSLARDR